MSIMDNVKDKLGIGRSSTILLVVTPLGKGKLEKPDTPENDWKVLNHLNENGPSTVHEVAEGVGMSEGKVKRIVDGMPLLIRKSRSTEDQE